MSLEGKVALIAGASRGIGADISRYLAATGAKVAVASILGDKEWTVMLERLAYDMDVIILTQPLSVPDSRRWDIEEARDYLLRKSNTPVHVIESLNEALDCGRELCGHGTVVITGSTYTVGDARTLMKAA